MLRSRPQIIFAALLALLISGAQLSAHAGHVAPARSKPQKADLKDRRLQIQKEIEAAVATPGRGLFDATTWGEDITNPFTNITTGGIAKLKAEGVDVDRLAALKAVVINGSY